MISNFFCDELNEVWRIDNYHPPAESSVARFKMVRNGRQAAVLQLVALDTDQDLAGVQLCAGAPEADLLPVLAHAASVTEVCTMFFIERSEHQVIYRSRSCPLFLASSTEGSSNGDLMCDSCLELIGHIRDINMGFQCKKEIVTQFGPIVDEENLSNENYYPVIDHIESENEDPEHYDMENNYDGDHYKLEPYVKLEFKPGDNGIAIKRKKMIKSKNPRKQCGVPTTSQYLCPQSDCGQKFKYHRRLIEHALKQHDIIIPSKDLPSKEEKCPFCDEKFNRDSAFFVSHVQALHCAERENPVYIDFMNTHMKTHVCQVCGQTFSTRQGFDLHMREAHENVLSDKMQTCPTCGKSFKNLDNHMKTHETETSLCVHCGKTFKNKVRLKTHIMLIHKQKEVVCSVCQNVFQSRRKLARHVKLHHLNIRAYQCELCSKCFPEKSKLTKHIMAVHDKIKPYVCEICGFKCARVDNLNLHRRKSHNEQQYLSREMLKLLVEKGEHPYCDAEYLPLLHSDVRAFNK